LKRSPIAKERTTHTREQRIRKEDIFNLIVNIIMERENRKDLRRNYGEEDIESRACTIYKP